MTINLNEEILVKLTDYGKEIYYHRFDDLNDIGEQVIEPHFPKVNEEGYTKFQLWEFIQLYGPHIGMGFKNVIQPLDIIVKGRENDYKGIS